MHREQQSRLISNLQGVQQEVSTSGHIQQTDQSLLIHKFIIDVTTGMWARGTLNRHAAVWQRLNATRMMSPATALQDV